jgi:SAM-dependent methyltransferase
LEGIRLEPRERVHVITAEEFYRANSHKFDQRAKETANVVREVKYIKVILNFVFKNRRKFDIEILDAGCGNGRISLPLIEEGYLVYGVDIFEDFINQLLVKVKNEKKSMTDFMRGIYYRPENFFLKGNILDLPFDNNKFDCILLMWHVVVEVSDYLDELFKHLYTKLKVGGIIVFDIPDKNDQTTQVAYQESENSKANYEAYLARAPEAREIINSLKKHRFESVRTKERFKKTFRIGVRKHVFIARKKGFAGTVFRIKDLI